jgi:quercetin dioxygenase-like cupin family protein
MLRPRIIVRLTLALALIAVHAPAGRANAQDSAPAKDYPAAPLLSTSTTILGETIRYPKTGPAHVTAAIVTLAPGARTIMHKHGVPLFAYILDGELTVDYGMHGTRTYRQGQSFMEAMAVAHFGVNNGSQPVRLLAVYMGAKHAKDVIPAKK